MKKKKTLLFMLFIFILLIVFNLLHLSFLTEFYIKLFHKNVIINHYNKDGKLDGEYIAYLNGKIYGKSFFKNGLRDGWNVTYDDKTGNKINEVFYKNGKADSVANVYYVNGVLNYKQYYKNDKPYGSFFRYSKNGKIDLYSTFDVSGNQFLVYHYDKQEHIIQTEGMIISPIIYTAEKDSTIILKNNDTVISAKDLYLTIATPPGLKPKFNISINHTNVTNFEINNNTIIVKNVFNKKGDFVLAYYGEFKDKDKNVVRSPRLIYNIQKM